MRDNRHITAFYLEALILIAVFIAVILVLTHVFGIGQRQSADARTLTDAVCLAQNAAEAVSASKSEEDLLLMLDRNGSASESGGVITAGYDRDMVPDADGDYLVLVTWEPDGADPALVISRISVYRGGGEEPVYTLDTAVFTGEAAR